MSDQPFHPATVMVVEDSPIVRQPLEAALNREGYRTLSAENGQDAMEHIRRDAPDLILLDLAMPVMDGMTLLRKLRKGECGVPRGLPVIVLSAIAEKQKVIEAIQLGISSYLLKSRFSLDELLALVKRVLREHLEGANMAGPSVEHQARTFESAAQNNDLALSTRNSAPRPDTSYPSHDVSTSDPAEALKDLKPLMTRSELVERLENCGELKGLSPAVAQVLKLTSSDRCSVEQVSKAISRDHAIALKVLKLANSAIYSRGEPVDAVHTAVMRIGLGQIRQAVLNITVVEHFGNQSGCAGAVLMDQYWEHAVATGIIAAEIARVVSGESEAVIDAAFTMGLLHDVGRVFFASSPGFREHYATILQTAQRLELPLEQVEQRMLLYNHADVMDRILHGWKFSKQLINPIVFHHLSAGNIRRNAPRQIEQVATLGLANRLAHAMMLGSSGNETIYTTHELCEMIKLDPKVIAHVHEMARDETSKVKFALLANTSAANWVPRCEHHREHINSSGGEPFRPLFVSMKPGIDAIGIFCRELTSESDGQPNIGVIHISDARDRVAVTSAYRIAEQEQAKGAALPLIVLSPAGRLEPEHSLLAGRAVESLPIPFIIPRFTAAAARLLRQTPMRAAA